MENKTQEHICSALITEGLNFHISAPNTRSTGVCESAASGSTHALAGLLSDRCGSTAEMLLIGASWEECLLLVGGFILGGVQKRLAHVA